ncbi:MAG TPA: carbonic anhydrase [Steroidobacteraceae bacterium]|jgi:carbonic anhydrase|nr:carbonic anhydrase [Steroidobacteraceae bacterium]
MISARAALAALREGNARFVADLGVGEVRGRRRELPAGQEPMAIILGCSDARVPAEIVFDQGLGDLFVIRVAGNIVAPSQVGSVEFAAAAFGTRLVVVLGHSNCGAIHATLEQLARPSKEQSPNLRSIVNRIRPAVEGLLERGAADRDALVHEAVRANIRMSANHLRHGSEVLEQAIERDGLLVVGAEYSLESGEVDFFDGVPAPETTSPGA